MRTVNFPMIGISLSWLALLLNASRWVGLAIVHSVLLVVFLQLTSLVLIITYVEVIFSPGGLTSGRRELAPTMLFAGLVAIFTFFLSGFPIWLFLGAEAGGRPAVLECSLPPGFSLCSLVEGLDVIEMGLWLPLGLANFLGGLR